MDTWQDIIGEWATLTVRARERDSAVRRATRAARRAGYRVADVAAANRQSGGHGHRWHVELRLEPRAGVA